MAILRQALLYVRPDVLKWAVSQCALDEDDIRREFTMALRGTRSELPARTLAGFDPRLLLAMHRRKFAEDGGDAEIVKMSILTLTEDLDFGYSLWRSFQSILDLEIGEIEDANQM